MKRYQRLQAAMEDLTELPPRQLPQQSAQPAAASRALHLLRMEAITMLFVNAMWVDPWNGCART